MLLKNKDKKYEYQQEIEYKGNYKIIHNIPIMTEEEKKEKEKEILYNIYQHFIQH